MLPAARPVMLPIAIPFGVLVVIVEFPKGMVSLV